MRTDLSKSALVACVSIVAMGCGGGASEGSGGGGTSGGEEPIVCSVPNSPAMDDYVAGARSVRSGDASGMAAIERSCEAGNACGCSTAGLVLATGEIVGRDIDRGIGLLERGCQGGDAWGCAWLGAALFDNRADQGERVAELYATACDDGIADACGGLARLHMSGIGGTTDPEDAVRRYDAACQAGNTFACYFQGQAAQHGLGMEADATRARELLSFACEQAQMPMACTSLAEIDTENRDTLLRRACDGGDVAACVTIEPPAAGDGTAASALAIPAADAEAREVATNEEESSSTPTGGDVDLSSLGLPRTCVGFVGRDPDKLVRVPAGVDAITIRASADADSVIAVRDAAGVWHCNDDLPGGSYHAGVRLTQPAAGVIAIWAGALIAGERSGTIDVTTEGVEPLNPTFATPARPETLRIPAASRAHFYQLRVMNAAGVGGTIRLDGHDVWPFGPDGGQVVSSENVQCLLTAAAHTLEMNVTSRARTAHGTGGGPLVTIELHATAAAGDAISDTTRLFHIQWSPPEAPAQRTATFRLSRPQAADRAQCAAAAP